MLYILKDQQIDSFDDYDDETMAQLLDKVEQPSPKFISYQIRQCVLDLGWKLWSRTESK